MFLHKVYHNSNANDDAYPLLTDHSPDRKVTLHLVLLSLPVTLVEGVEDNLALESELCSIVAIVVW